MKYLLPMFLLSLLFAGDAMACENCGFTYQYRVRTYRAPRVTYYTTPQYYVQTPRVVVQSAPVDPAPMLPAPVQEAPRYYVAAPFATVEVPVGVSYYKSETKTYRDGRVRTKTTIRN